MLFSDDTFSSFYRAGTRKDFRSQNANHVILVFLLNDLHHCSQLTNDGGIVNAHYILLIRTPQDSNVSACSCNLMQYTFFILSLHGNIVNKSIACLNTGRRYIAYFAYSIFCWLVFTTSQKICESVGFGSQFYKCPAAKRCNSQSCDQCDNQSDHNEKICKYN